MADGGPVSYEQMLRAQRSHGLLPMTDERRENNTVNLLKALYGGGRGVLSMILGAGGDMNDIINELGGMEGKGLIPLPNSEEVDEMLPGKLDGYSYEGGRDLTQMGLAASTLPGILSKAPGALRSMGKAGRGAVDAAKLAYYKRFPPFYEPPPALTYNPQALP